MPRQKTQQNPEKGCKIRKRVLSSSSSSSVVKNYRFKRAILAGKVTMASGSRSPVQNLQGFETNGVISSNNHNQIKGKEGFSARKLAATLWEINGLHSPDGDRAVCEKIDGSKVGGQKRRSSATSQKLQNTEYIPSGEGLDTPGKFSSIVAGDNISSFKTRLKGVNNCLVASKGLVKVLFRIIPHSEQHSSRITLVSALRVELDRARLQIDQMIQEQRYKSNEINTLLKNPAVSSIEREIEIERKMRRQAERLNKKLGVELANSRAHLSRAMKALEGEKREKEILGRTYNELAKGIGEERVEMEKERQMLKLADVLREERVQMKLTDARYEYEEQNAALERLKTELDLYFKNQGSTNKEIGDNGVSDFDRKLDLGMKTQLGSYRNKENESEVDEDGLHTIELSMDNKNKNYKWSFVCDGQNEGEVFKGRRSLSEKIQWENICLQRSTSDGIEWEFSARKQGNVDGFDQGNRSGSNGSDSESPAISTGKSSCLREACNAILLDLASRKG